VYDAFTLAATAQTEQHFKAHMATIERLDQAAYKYIMDRPPEEWAVSQMPRCCWGKYTSNDSESFNSTFAGSKNHLPLFALLRTVVSRMYNAYNAGARRYLSKHRRGARAGRWEYDAPLPPKASRWLAEALVKAQVLGYEAGGPLDGRTISRHSDGVSVTNIVDLEPLLQAPDGRRDSLCSCGVPAITGGLCLHAVRVITELDEVHHSLMHPLLTTQANRDLYSAMRDARLPPDIAWTVGEIPQEEQLRLPLWLRHTGNEDESDGDDDLHPVARGRRRTALRYAAQQRPGAGAGAGAGEAGGGDHGDGDGGDDSDDEPLWRVVGALHAGRHGHRRRESAGALEQRAVLRLSQQARALASQPVPAEAEAEIAAADRRRRRRRAYRCGNCGDTSHNARRCDKACGHCGDGQHKRNRCPRLGLAAGAAQRTVISGQTGGGSGSHNLCSGPRSLLLALSAGLGRYGCVQ